MPPDPLALTWCATVYIVVHLHHEKSTRANKYLATALH